MRSRLTGVTVVIPAYNEDNKILTDLRAGLMHQGANVVIVDDGSKDPHPKAFRHKKNQGYGAALMTGIRIAQNDLIICMDGDGQHTVESAVNLNIAWQMMDTDMLIGKRRTIHESWYRFVARKAINWTASVFATYWLPDLNSGMRMFSRKAVIGYFPILCKTFSFTTSLTLSMVCDNKRVEWFPIAVQDRQYGKTRVKYLKDGLITLWYIIYIGGGIRTRGIRKWLRKIRM